MSSKRTDVLIAAHALIQDRTRWTQGTLARDRYGDCVNPKNPNSVQWCAVGAIQAVPGTYYAFAAARSLLDDVTMQLYNLPEVIPLNDMIGYEQTLRVFETAICASKQMDEQNESQEREQAA